MSPARERLFDDQPLPEAVVLDCDFVVHVLHEREEFHNECLDFALRLYANDAVIIYSNLLRVEFWQAWRRAAKRRGQPLEIESTPMLWTDPIADRRRLLDLGDQYLKEFLGSFPRYEVRVGRPLLNYARQLVIRHDLGSRDACVAACADYTGVPHVVSLDAAYRRIDHIHLWNDDIPRRRTQRRA